MNGRVVPELRTDWLTGRTVILAEHRANRPTEFAASASSLTQSSLAAVAACSFCTGHESQTPAAVDSRADELGHWRVRVVPNMYPAVTLPRVDDLASPASGDGTISAIGAHEVIIESARHIDRTSDLTVPEFSEVLAVYSGRLGHWHDDGRFEYGLVFKNVGAWAGASLTHLHSQFIALPQLPAAVAAEFQRAEQHYAKHQKCAYCDLVASERAAGERIVFDRDCFIAFCPYASLQPCEVWLLPTDHEAWFERRPNTDAADRLAEVLHPLLARVEAIVPQAAYNLLVRTAPWRSSAARCGHWRIEILPRVNPLAGFELATGIHINPISPTRAAEQLRSS
jgi:UDPglucose--hexose-1-phosphate uridylyltransferase